MGGEITRDVDVLSVTADTVLADATAIDMQQYATLMVYVPAGAASQTYTVYAAPSVGGTYLALKDKDGTAVTLTVAASEAHEINPATFAAGAIKLVAGTSDESVTVTRKS